MTDDPLTPDVIRKTCQRYAGEKEPTEFDTRKWGAMLGWLNKYLATDEMRHLVTSWLFAFPGQDFEPMSSTELTPQQKYAISRWVGSTKNDDTDEWETRPTFQQECLAVMNAARYDYHKLHPKDTSEFHIIDHEGELAGQIADFLDDPLWNPEQHSDKRVTGIAVG